MHAGLRQRRNAAAAAMAQGAGGRAADGRPIRRQRVFTLRISTRQLLQIIVFCIVLYQVSNAQGVVFSAVIPMMVLMVTKFSPQLLSAPQPTCTRCTRTVVHELSQP
jgi:hypothetical protein